MEVVPCVQKAGSHAASLLERLNVQRERAQFCDCVVRQRQNPSQLYPAHRCVLAASSPVLASILSSSSALVELQAPCLSDSVLALVLDFMYTGDLPSTRTQQQYYNLLTAACHLQMDELQKTLRTEVNPEDNTNASSGAENQPHKDINNAYSKTANTFRKYLPLSDCSAKSPQRKDQYCDGTDTCRSSGKTDANHHSRKEARPLSNVRTGCGVAENTGSVFNIGNCREVTPLTPQELISCTTVVNVVSRLDKEMQKDHFHSAVTVKPECWQMITEEGLVKTVENRRSLYLEEEVQEENMRRAQEAQCLAGIREAGGKQTNRKEDKIQHSPPLSLLTTNLKDTVSPSQCSSSLLHPCGGAVPVIRHSGTATMAEVSTTPPYHPVSKVSVSSGRASDSGSTDSDRIAEGVTTKHKSHYRVQSQDYKLNKKHTETQSWYHSDQCIIQDLCYKSNVDQSDILKQDYNSSNTNHDEHMGNGLSHIVDENDHCAHCDSFQNKNQTKCLRASVPLKRDLSSFDDFPTKYQQLDCSDCCNVSIATAAEEQSIHSQDLRVVVHDADAGSDSHCEDLCAEGEVKEESKCPAEMDRYDSHWNLYGPKNDGYPSLHRAETSTKDAGSSHHEHDNTDTDMDNVTGEHCTSLEHENISGTEISESHLTFTMPVDNNVSDPSYTVVGQSYCGHLRYHCLPQENTHLRYGDSDRKHSYLGHAGYSDQSSDVEEADTVASPGLSPLRKHFATTDQILLLDISTKSAELLVSYRQRPDEQEKRVAFSQKDTFANELGDNDREQRHEATLVAGVDKRQISARTKTEAKIFNEAVALAGETNGKERKSVSKEQIRPRGEVIHKAGVVEDENQAVTALTVCSPPHVSDSVQAPVPSSSPGCIASTLSASMPTNKSAPLSTPVHHPFQCSLCSRSFSQRGSLNRHVRSHLGVRPFPCPRCPMTFSRQYRVSEHMRVHQRCVLGIDFQKPHAS